MKDFVVRIFCKFSFEMKSDVFIVNFVNIIIFVVYWYIVNDFLIVGFIFISFMFFIGRYCIIVCFFIKIIICDRFFMDF